MEHPQFVIWIDPFLGHSAALQHTKTITQRVSTPTKALEASLRGYQPLRLTQQKKQRKKHRYPAVRLPARRRLGAKRTAGANRKVTLFTVVIVG